MKRRISAILACAVLLTACAAPTESTQTSATDSTTSSATTTAADTSTADTSTADTTTAPAEIAPTVDAESVDITVEIDTIETVEAAVPETEEQPVVTTTTAATTTAATTTTATTTAATTATATTVVTTTTTAATTTTAPTEEKEPVEIPTDFPDPADFAEFSYDSSSAARIEGYGIDTAERIAKYEVMAKETKLPIIHISTEDELPIMSREEYNNCLVDLFNCEEEHILRAVEGGIKIRGNSTAYYGDPNEVLKNQVPYRIKFSKKANMMGLNDGAECKSWVLLKGTWNVIPDHLAFTMAETLMKDDYYSSDSTFVYVYVNEQFKGLYLLCEQNQINKHRVDLPEPEKDYKGTDIGYFVEIDNYASEEPYWFTVDYCGETLTDLEGTERALEPADYTIKNDIYSEEQVTFISDYVNNVYKLMVQAIKYGRYYEFDDSYQLVAAQDKYTSAYECINAEVDLNSVVNMYILYEIAHDNDCGEGSFYMARDFSGESSFDRLTFTAPWDFNWAYEGSPVRKYYAAAFNDEGFVNQYGDRTNPWFVLLMGTDWFQDMVKARWQELYNNGEITAVLDYLSVYVDHYQDDFHAHTGYWADCARDLIKWVRNRVKWLNMEWGNQ